RWAMTTILRRIGLLVILAAIWEAGPRLFGLPAYMFPSLGQVGETLWQGILSGQITTAIAITLGCLLIGSPVAILLRLIFGSLTWRYKLREDTLCFLVTAL